VRRWCETVPTEGAGRRVRTEGAVADAGETALESVVHAFGGSLVDAAGRAVQDGGTALRERSERLATLHRQGMLLAGLREEAESALSTFPVALASSWSSDAQRLYAGRSAELRHELVRTVRALEEAEAGLVEAIATLALAEAG
jgi:hypothetical protein